MFVFDGGGAGAAFTDLARGYIALLAPLQWSDGDVATTRGPYFRTLRRLPFEPSPEMVSEFGNELIGNTPSCLIQIKGAEVEEQKVGHVRWRVTVRVHVVGGHERLEASGRLEVDEGDGRTTLDDPGLDVMLAHAVEQIHYQQPDARSESIKMKGVKHMVDTPEWSWWYIETEVVVRQNVCVERAEPLIDERVVNSQTPPGTGDLIIQKVIHP